MIHNKEDGWKWLLGNIPSLGGHWLFEAKIESIEYISERITIRRFSQIKYEQNNKDQQLLMHVLPWVYPAFEVVNDLTEGKLDSNSVVHFVEADEKLIVEALKAWIPERVKPATQLQMKQQIKKAEVQRKIITNG